MISCIITVCIVLYVIIFAKVKAKADGFECFLYGILSLFGGLIAICIISCFITAYYPSVVGEEKLEVCAVGNEMVYISGNDKIENVDECSDVKIDDSVKKPYVLKEIYDNTYWLEGCKYTLVLPGNIA